MSFMEVVEERNLLSHSSPRGKATDRNSACSKRHIARYITKVRNANYFSAQHVCHVQNYLRFQQPLQCQIL